MLLIQGQGNFSQSPQKAETPEMKVMYITLASIKNLQHTLEGSLLPRSFLIVI